MTPIVLVSADVRPADGYRWHAAPHTYLEALAGMGLIPLILPDLPGALPIEDALARVDGVLLTGSRSNVHPARYGHPPSERHEPYDFDRDATTLPLVRATLAAGLPLLAICRGFQELNVALGGTLATEAQERPGSLDHRSKNSDDQDVRFALAHRVRFVPDGILARALGRTEIEVNSLHRQVIDRLAPGLVVEGHAPDGTIEAVRVADAKSFAIGVQWHPEYWAASDAPSRAIFAAFAEAVGARMRRAFPAAAE
ncbi:gamma-glutamyl-gamma-aminobutyrate hydrolase family protein [Propylenella binzhouense]|uniref:gamma-glutamyl-gamma-aminobutyrate hydrolase n=1 Tax=Propylenella binzhouense TaxID=2555902 RepID=A0A964WTW8_9HYPH|nr:gamma-glutamyl-gamma-aminobutyrate hydrolase family protein [Propylenella binzhouense]MYZ48245.1 gamma-glutamyl-gamma-aminobutyrate hydrolase family protein [Propylenella binzhouense]